MSMYVDFFIKRDNKFIRIADYSRNSQVYKIISDCLPYEKVRALTIQDLDKFNDIAREDIEECKKHIEKINMRISNISSFNNSIEDKLEAIHTYEMDKSDWEDDIKELQFAKIFFTFLEDLIESGIYGEESKEINSDKYLYAGIEVGEPVEVEE